MNSHSIVSYNTPDGIRVIDYSAVYHFVFITDGLWVVEVVRTIYTDQLRLELEGSPE